MSSFSDRSEGAAWASAQPAGILRWEANVLTLPVPPSPTNTSLNVGACCAPASAMVLASCGLMGWEVVEGFFNKSQPRNSAKGTQRQTPYL